MRMPAILKLLFYFNTSHLEDGGFSDWISGTCSVSCGSGEKRRYRECNNPVPKYGGKDCKGVTHETIVCELQPCPGEMLVISLNVFLIK